MDNDKIIKLKAELFDLQLEFNRIRRLIEAKLKELSEAQKEK